MSVSSMDITLERPSGVYYAGEVVRGTVTLVTTDVVDCRGFFCRFRGRARAHWHRGRCVCAYNGGTVFYDAENSSTIPLAHLSLTFCFSNASQHHLMAFSQSGDNRTDYDGQTLFQCQYQTLAGNFYRTPLLDEAGSEADFDVVANSGVLRIPCANIDEHQLQLILRLMDYDWGKRDDLLGEIVVDVPALLRSRSQQTYPLTRRGRPEKGQVTLSAKWLPWKALFSTPPEVGSEYCLELTIHKAWDLRKADWIGHNDVYAQVYRVDTTQQPINLSRALPKPDKKYKLPKGKTVYPFCFAIRTDAPGSAELPVYDYGYIRYDIYANVDKAFWRDPSRKRVITVVPNRPVPLPALLKGPVQRTLPEQLVHGMECCGCKCGRLDGLVSARLELDRQSYAAGEVMMVRGNVASTIAQPLSVALVLTMYVSMYTMRGMTNFGKKEIVVWSDTLPANTTMTLEQLVGGKTLRMPHTYPSFGGGAETPQMAKQSATRQLKRHYACLRWTYTLGLRVSKNLNGGGGIQAGIPVLVAAAPPYANAIATESSPREVGSSAPEDVLAQALSTRENSTTTPRLTVRSINDRNKWYRTYILLVSHSFFSLQHRVRKMVE